MYTFFETSDKVKYVESTNWCMRYFSRQEDVEQELCEFVERWPYRDTDEWEEWLHYTRARRYRLMKKFFQKEKLKNMDCNTKCTDCVNMNHTHAYTTPPRPNQVYTVDAFGGGNWVSLGNCTTTANTPTDYPFGYNLSYNQNQEEGNNPMCYAKQTVKFDEVNESTVLQDQRKFLLNDLYEKYITFRDDLHSHFHMDPVGPKNAGEALEWLKAGKYKEIPKEKLQDGFYYLFQLVTWEDKENPADVDGYNAAIEKLKKAYNDATRTIKIKSPEAGLDALVAFESATFH
jgi:hypothetical protein